MSRHFLRDRSTWAFADKVYLEDLDLAEGTRGRGVGGALIEAVVATAAAERLDEVYWLTTRGNTVARGLSDQLTVVTPFVQYRAHSSQLVRCEPCKAA